MAPPLIEFAEVGHTAVAHTPIPRRHVTMAAMSSGAIVTLLATAGLVGSMQEAPAGPRSVSALRALGGVPFFSAPGSSISRTSPADGGAPAGSASLSAPISAALAAASASPSPPASVVQGNHAITGTGSGSVHQATLLNVETTVAKVPSGTGVSGSTPPPSAPVTVIPTPVARSTTSAPTHAAVPLRPSTSAGDHGPTLTLAAGSDRCSKGGGCALATSHAPPRSNGPPDRSGQFNAGGSLRG